jgi:divalent metal cation (Fe/Co/Zn/Cd) transporter
MPINLPESLLIALVLLLAYSVFQAIQLPLFFRYGYAKAKLLSYLPLVVLPVVVILYVNTDLQALALGDLISWSVANPALTVLIVAVVWIAIMYVSYRISCMVYRKRDF